MTWLRPLTIAIALTLAHQSIVAQSPAEIALPGTYLGKGPWERWSGRWLALVERDRAFELREVAVSTTGPSKSPCSDTSVDFNVFAPGTASDTLLVRGVPALTVGPVITAFRGDMSDGTPGKFLRPGDGLAIPIGHDSPSFLIAFGTVRPGGGGLGEPRITEYEVHMVSGRRMAPVFSLPLVSNDRPPRILWAGDLDGDHVTDVFADLPPHYNARHYVLFLSSLARGGQLVAEAASLAFVGC